MMKQPGCVLLDRDGTINVEKCYLSSPDQLELIPRAAAGLRKLRQLGLKLAIVTNQSGIARGYFDEARLERIHARLRAMLRVGGVEIDGVFYCPHHPGECCSCRKPGTGLVERAARELGFARDQLFVIGDKPCDIEMGTAAGATTLLVRTGYGREVEEAGTAQPDYIVDHLEHAAAVIAQRLEPHVQPVQSSVGMRERDDL